MKSISITAIATGMLLLMCTLPAASQRVATEGEIKAAFVFNFVKFVEWPEVSFPGPDLPLVLCTLNGANLDGELSKFHGTSANGRVVQIQNLIELDNSAECHVIFFGQDGREHFTRPGRQPLPPHVLTIGDSEGFALAGGMINFFSAQQRVRFEINLNAVRSSSLRFSPDLLSLARIIDGEPQ